MNSVVLERSPAPATAVTVRDLRPGDAAGWAEFVRSRDDASFFHRLEWKQVVEQAFGQDCHYLVAETDGRVTGVLPLFHQRSLLFGNALISIPFCVYGGAVAINEAIGDALIDAAVARAEELGADYLELRHRQRRRPQWPAKDLYVTFRKEISADDDDNLAAIPRKQRAMIRKGQKAGLSARVVTEIGDFYAMYAASVRNLGTPVLPRRYFSMLMQAFGDDVEVLVIEHDGTPVSAVMSFYHGNEVLPYYGGGTSRARALKANDFMYWEVMRRAVARGVGVFDFGRSKRDTGSYRFKKHWGFEPQPLHYEYGLTGIDEMPDVSPANPKYRLFIAAWQKLPLPVANLLGPLLARRLG